MFDVVFIYELRTLPRYYRVPTVSNDSGTLGDGRYLQTEDSEVTASMRIGDCTLSGYDWLLNDPLRRGMSVPYYGTV
jgi:hypothetical protein